MSEFGGFEPPTGPPAGWYPDPYGGPGQRYWDGREWDLSTPARAGADVDHASDEFPAIGDWLDRAFRVAYRRWKSLAILALITAPASTALSYLAIIRAFDGLVIEGDEVTGWTNDRIPAVTVMLLLAVVIGAIGSLAVSVLMLRAVDGDEISDGSVGQEWSAVVRTIGQTIRILPRAIGWFLALMAGIAGVGVGFAVVAVAAPAGAVLLAFAAIPLLVWLAIKWSFAGVAVIDRPGNPFTRSGKVCQGRWWRTFGRLLLIGIIVWLVSVIVQTPGSLATGGGFAGWGGDTITIDDDGSIERFAFDEQFDVGTLEIVVASIVSIITTVLATSVMASAMSVLYRTRNPRD